MSETITLQGAAAYLEWWRRLCELESEKVARMSPEAKLHQVETLFEMAEVVGWPEDREAEAERVRERWRRLRAASSG